MALFTNSIPVILMHEGGLTNDTGGLTKFGISQKTYPNLDIKNLTADDAKKIYLRDFWNPLKLDNFTNQHLATFVLDTAVNMGQKVAVKMLQIALLKAGENLVVDGIIGPQTTGAANRQKPEFINSFIEDRIQFYENLATANPAKYAKFKDGWIDRAESYLVKKKTNLIGLGAIALGALAFIIYKKKR